jgi:hypothetical protein
MRFGFTDKEWDAGKAEITTILQEVAGTQRGMISYSDLCHRVHSIAITHDDPALWNILGEISTTNPMQGAACFPSL